MAVPAHLPHELMGYSLDDVEGVLLSLTIISEVSTKQERAMKHPTNNAKQNQRRTRMKNKKPGYV